MKVLVRDQKLKEVRNQDMIAGVLYGKEIDPVKVMVDRKEFFNNYHEHGQVSVFPCELNGETHKVYIKEIQKDVMFPERVLNFDLLKVTSKDKIHARIPIHLVNKDLLESKGLIIQQNLHEIEAYYSIDQSPDDIKVDVSHLDNGISLKLSEIQLPDYLDIHTDMELVVVAASLPKTSEEPEVEEPVREPILIGEEEDEA